MLIPGKEVDGYMVLTVHQTIADPTLGTYLARHMETGEFRVGHISADLSDLWSMTTGETFDSYVNAAGHFYKILDEEAYLHESGQI